VKIVRLSTFLDFGGIEKRLINISYHNDDNEWIFYAINKGGAAEAVIKSNNKKAICLNLPFKIPSLITINKLYSIFKAEKPDVVHTSGAEANFHGIIAAKLAGVPVKIAEEIGVPGQGRVAKRIFSIVYSLANVVVGNSLPVLNFLNQHNEVPLHKLKLIANPLLFPVLEKRQITNDDAFNIVSISRLEPVKNIESVLRVLPRLLLHNKNIKYTIVGEGKSRGDLEALVMELKIVDNVVFTGFQDNPYSFLLNADLFVLTSFSEGFSNSLVEAMYSGTPCLSTEVGAATDIIKDSENGWLVPPADDDALFEKLLFIIKEGKGVLFEVGLKGKQMVETNFSLSNHIEKLLRIYEN
jgi:glycosyltransferase involved in cell wall biosynthesis